MSAVDIIDGRGYILNVEFGGGKDGVDGKDGRDGVAPDLQIGTVKESEDDQPHVTISDEGDGKLSLNFDLVPGNDGRNGEDGGVFIPSVSQEGVISWIAPEGQNPPQSVSVKGKDGATFTPTVSTGGEISWTNDKGLDNPDERNIRGPKGEKGDPFTIYKVYNSKAEMDADYSNPDVPMGAFVCITNSVDQSENARLYVKGTQQYTFITDLSGATGMQGVPGVGIGRVSLMDNQPSPLYKDYGVWSDQTPEVLLGTFNLPVGKDGQQGNDGVGIESIEQTTKSHEDDGVNVITVKLTDGKTSTFNVENGSKGSTGAQGPAGHDGQDGQDGIGIDDITVEQSTFDGQPNVVTVHLSNGTTETFNVYNGHTGATGTAGTLNTNNTSAVIPTSESMSGNINLHKISKTGNYNDLLNKPTIPAAANDSTITIQKNGTTVNTFTLNQSSPKIVNIPIPTTVAELSDASNYALVSSLATVATSGSYTDLSNRPVIGNAELKIQSIDNTTPETYTEIGKFHANAASPETITLSKVARTGKYNDLTNKPAKSVYSDASDLVNINNWPSIHTIEMGRKAAFVTDGDQIAPTVLLQYGSPIATGKQKWNGSSGDYIRYVPLAENKEYVLEFTVTSFDFNKNGQYIEDNDISCIFYAKVETGANGYLLNTPELMKGNIKDSTVRPASGVVGTAAWSPTSYVTFYPNKKVGTVTFGSNTFDVMTYNSGFQANEVQQANGEYWLSGIQLYANINGQKKSLSFTGTGHPVTIDDNGEGILNDTGWHLIHNGTSYPAVIEHGVTVGKMGAIGWEERKVSFKDNLPNGIGRVADGTLDNIAYNREGLNVVIEVDDLSTAIDNIETTYDDGRNKIILFSAPEDDGGEQKRLVIALTRSLDGGIEGVDVSVAIRVLKSESKYRTYMASDYDHIDYTH